MPEFIPAFLTHPATMWSAWILTLLLIFNSSRVKKFSIGKFISFEGNAAPTQIPASLIDSKDVTCYDLLLKYIFFSQDGIIADIRYRVRKNGWEKRPNWSQYVNDAMYAHTNKITQTLDKWYPSDALVERIKLYEWNKAKMPEIQDRMKRMYDTMYDIFKEAHAEADRLRCILKNPTVCQGNEGGDVCIGAIKAMQYLSDIHTLEGVDIREQCMNEAERALLEIMQILFSHYLTIYKRTTHESSK